MTTATFVACAAFALLAAGADLRSRRVPDGLLLCALWGALFIAGLEGGLSGLWKSFLGGAVGLAVLLPVGLAGILGGGDVKFAATAGAFLGPARAFQAALAGALLAGLGLAAARVIRGSAPATLPVAPALALATLAVAALDLPFISPEAP